MLDVPAKVCSKIQEFMGRVTDLEDESEETKKELAHLRKEFEILQKNMKFGEKIQAHQAAEIEKLAAGIKKLGSENRGAKISAGMAKAEVKKLKAAAKH
jgi:predicted RNase H-like nuclease (RuvC/YqgF family)